MELNEKRENVVAFVNDNLSEQIIDRAIREFDVENSKILQGSVEYAKVYLKDHTPPYVLILDLSDRDVPIKDLQDISEFCDPSVKVIVISDINDVNFCRNLMHIGVEDYLLKPLHINFLREIFYKIFKPEDMMSTRDIFKNINMVGFVSSRGGLGATTFAVNSAFLISHDKNKKVLLMDQNFYSGDMNILLDRSVEDSYIDILRTNSQQIDDFLIDSVVQKVGEKFFLLSGNLQFGQYIKNDVDEFKSLINTVKGKYNYCIIDMNLNYHEIFSYLLEELDTLFIVSDLTLSSARDTARIITYAKKHKIDMACSVILNKVGIAKKGAISESVFEKIIGMPISHKVAYDPEIPVTAANLGKLIVETKSGAIYKNISNIADEMCFENTFAIENGKRKKKNKSGFFKKLFSKKI